MPTMRARHRDRQPPRTGADEKAVLLGFLGHLREAIVLKVQGVPEPQVRTAGVPSGTSLLGLLKHLAHVERFVVLGEDTPDWAATFRPKPGESVEGLVAAYHEAIAEADRAVAVCPDLGLPAAPRRGGAPSMRWVLVHMIEETGRHAGHADILREQIDGVTGR